MLLLIGCRLTDEGPATTDQGGQARASGRRDVNYVGGTADVSLYVVESEDGRWVELHRGTVVQRYAYWSAALLDDGTVLLADAQLGMYRLTENGNKEKLLDAYEVNGNIQVDPSGRYVAYAYPLVWFGDDLLNYGVGVYDLKTGESILLVSDAERPAEPLGWAGSQVVFWWTGGDGPLTVNAVDLEGKVTEVLAPKGLARLLFVRDGKLVYETSTGGTVVHDLTTGEDTEFPGVTHVAWTRDGLEGLVNGSRSIIVEVGP